MQDEEAQLSASFASLASVLEDEEPPPLTHDPLLLACRIVGKKLGIHFQASKTHPNHSTTRIKEICEASSARYRQISLDGEWYRTDSGHFVGFLNQSIPVALISSGNGSYTMTNTVTLQTYEVNATIAASLSPIAFEFYASFPTEKLSWKEVIRNIFFKTKKQISFVLLITFAISLLNLFLPLIAKWIFGTAIPQLNKPLLWQLGIALLIAAVSTFLYQISQAFLIFRIVSIAGNRLETSLWDRILRLPLRFFTLFSSGDLYARISGFVTARRAFNTPYLIAILNALFASIYLIAMFFFSFILGVTAFFITTLGLVAFYFFLTRIVKLQTEVFEIKGKINGLIIQIIGAIGKLRTTNSEKKAFAQWANAFAEAKKRDLTSQYYIAAIDALFAMMPSMSTLLIFAAIIATMSYAGTPFTSLSVGNFFGFIVAFQLFNTAIFGSIFSITYLSRILPPIWKRGEVIFAAEPERKDPNKMEKQLQGSIAIEQVCFRYDDKHAYVLKNISLYAHPGEFIGLVGSSGSGKSTLFRLLLGFEAPETGKIAYDEIDLTHQSIHAIRRQLGVVLQHGAIMAGTIYENLVRGDTYSPEQIEKALHLSAFDQDLWSFPLGLQTVLTSGGETLSGGQRQRLLLASALICNPKILFLDEAASALDPHTYERVCKSIRELPATRIMAAHRLSALKACDRIYVLDQGEVIQQGRFDELASRPGLFSQLLMRQKI